MGPTAVRAVPALVEALDAKETSALALLALGRIGPPARGALPKLLAWPGSKETWWKRNLASAIRSIRGDLDR